MLLHKETHTIQSNLADYCRTGIKPQLPGITAGRLDQYRRLVYGVIDDTLEGAFPITKNLLNEEEWSSLVDGFFSKHACKNNSVWKMPFEFYEYYASTESSITHKYPFLVDLLYFEWIEIEVHTMPDVEIEHHRKTGNLLKDKLYLNPEYRIIQLHYPVHQLHPSQIEAPVLFGDYYVLVYRHQNSGDVEFFDISALFAYMISISAENSLSLPEIIDNACKTFGLENNINTQAQITGFFKTLHNKRFILGFK